MFDLDRLERLPIADLIRLQDRELERLLSHASAQVPFYEERLKRIGFRAGQTPVSDIWDAIPILTRADIQNAKTQLHAKAYPSSHGKTDEKTTSGSTNTPARILTTEYTHFMWQCINMRDRMWHRIDLGATLVELTGTLNVKGKTFIEFDSWSLDPTSLRNVGKRYKINPTLDISEQVQIIAQIEPAYLHTRPSQLNLLLKECEATGRRLTSLKAVFCLSEAVNATLRNNCRNITGASIIDCYSCAEVGYLALQCPEAEHFHIQSETVRVEVLNDDGSHCGPGETGRVIVTSLNNYAMPLIRYEIGDEAEVGAPCICGRSLPVLTQIVGRTQDYLKLRSGRQVRAEIWHYEIAKISAIKEFQIVQRTVDRLDMLVVTARPLNADETSRLKTLVAPQGGEMFDVSITPCSSLERTASGKLRTFICDVK